MKKTIQNHFDQYQLSGEQLRRLREIQSRATLPRFDSFLKVRRVSVAFVSVVAFLVIGVIGTLAWWQPWNRSTSISSLASEIAYHHNKQMVMEIESPSTSAVRAYLSKLDFPLIESERFPSTDWELVGGRYCSLKGHIAAQLRIRNKNSGKNVTFYQLLMPKEMPDLDGTFEVFEQGVRVELWKERGLLLGTAQEN
ncbi:MAG: hypothetical protein HY696_03925 [Deltaproteobacteria bacterium]|nr:hypothetical protein [Deltaproteobacteria bacterium]